MDLTIYETCNAFRKSWTKLHKISKEGIPNVVPCGSTTAISPGTIVIAAVFLDKTIKNIKENPRVALTFHSPAPPKEKVSVEESSKVKAYQVKGSAQLITSGPVYEKVKEMVMKRLGEFALKMLKGALVIKVEEIYNLTPGPEAGKKIA